jgi:hypothetical protein
MRESTGTFSPEVGSALSSVGDVLPPNLVTALEPSAIRLAISSRHAGVAELIPVARVGTAMIFEILMSSFDAIVKALPRHIIKLIWRSIPSSILQSNRGDWSSYSMRGRGADADKSSASNYSRESKFRDTLHKFLLVNLRNVHKVSAKRFHLECECFGGFVAGC